MKGRGGLFPAKRFINRAFQNEGEGGVRPSPSRRVMRKRSGRSNASAAKTVARSENCRARAFRSLLLGMLFRRLRGRDRSFCEWQSAGVLRLLYDRGTIPSSAPARLYIRRMAEYGCFARCCRGRCSDACADTTARPADGRARAYSRFLHARGTIPSSAPARSYIRRMAEHGRSAPCCWGCGSDACADTPERSGA